MKILFSADFHNDFTRLIQLADNFDLCICCGDIFDYHQLPNPEFEFPIPIYSIRGNKEYWGYKENSIEERRINNLFWLNNHLETLYDLTGIEFYGIDFLKIPKIIPKDIDYLITHQPAYGIADSCSSTYHAKMVDHCGNKSIKRLVDHNSPNFLISGHVHYYQEAKIGSFQAITLSPALTDPIVYLDNKKIKKSTNSQLISKK